MIIKSIKLVRLLQTRESVTVRDVANELGLARRSAHDWITAASMVLPIYGLNEEDRATAEEIRYKMLG